MREATKARTLFDQFIEQNQCYEGQISSSVGKFRRDLIIPIIRLIQELEKKADE